MISAHYKYKSLESFEGDLACGIGDVAQESFVGQDYGEFYDVVWMSRGRVTRYIKVSFTR